MKMTTKYRCDRCGSVFESNSSICQANVSYPDYGGSTGMPEIKHYDLCEKCSGELHRFMKRKEQ